MQRCAAHCASKTDIEESYMAGKAAMAAALAGESDVMVAFERDPDSKTYKCLTKLVPLDDVANVEKKVPREWINADGNGVTKEFIDYALPLIQGETDLQWKNGIPEFAYLQHYRVD